MRLTVVGNPGNRRISLFLAAARRAGLLEPAVLSWRHVLSGAPFSFEPGCLVRIESPGEDAEVDRLLRGAAASAQHGEITGGAAWFAGFSGALATLTRAAERDGARLLSQPDDILTMFDKRACHARLFAAGVPVPPAAEPVTSWQVLRESLVTLGWHRVFVKSRYGSSASGVLALEFGGHGRVQATTSVELAAGRLFNSLRVRHYRREADVAAIVDRLAPDGLHVERWFPKAGLAGHVIDLRVVVVNGQCAQVVVRGSKSPMTNLHLGGTRMDLNLLRCAAGPAYASALATCERVAGLFPATLHVGVDMMLAPGWRGHAVAEVNAFGDLLPNLLLEGRDAYDIQLHALTSVAGLEVA
jgi:hypothetical protein